MGWEERSGNHYYYRKMRHGRKVTSEYFGAGEVAEMFADLDEIERYERTIAQAEWKKQKDDLHKIDSDVLQAAILIRNIVRAYLLIAGYHPHKGQFRKRRNEK